MQKLMTLTLVFFSSFILSQQIKVLDEETRNPIPYAKLILKDKDYYKNTEENGETFLVENKEISEIQSFGYENLKVENYQTVYLLKAKFTEIDEVKIVRPQLSKSFKLGEVKKSNTFYGAANIIWSVGKEITKDISSQPLFVKSLKFYARLNEKKLATIKVNIYENENGLPTEIYKSYVVTCYKNKRITELIFEQPIYFPEEGIVVAFEWIFNKQNEYERVMIFNNEKKKMIAHEPMIGTIREPEKNIIIGRLNNGNWNFINTSSKETRNIGNLGVELELTN